MHKSSLIKILIVSIFTVLISTPISAKLISYESYSRDSSEIVVKGEGLEWLMWNQTYGISAKDAESLYKSSGWSIATNEQMANLFNSFKFNEIDRPLYYPRFPFISDENTEQKIGPHGDSQDANNLAAIAFIKLFNDLELNFQLGIEQIHAHAFFGTDEDNDGNINAASVNHDHFPDFSFIVSDIGLSSDTFNYSQSASPYRGTALVRSIKVNSPNNLFLISIAMLIILTSRKNRKFRFQQ